MTEPEKTIQTWRRAWSIRGFALIAAHERALEKALRSTKGDFEHVEKTGYALREFVRSTAATQRKS